MSLSWTEEAQKNLIQAYHDFPILWDPQHPDHFNRAVKSDAWQNLALQMGRPEEDCRRKMISLLSSYRRERGRRVKYAKAGKKYISRWFAYDVLRFLDDRQKPTSDVDNDGFKEDFDEDMEEDPLSQSHPSVSSCSSSMAPRFEPVYRRERSPIPRENAVLQNPCTFLETSSNSGQILEIPTIAKAWGEKLLELHSQQRAFAEKAINDILFEAGQGTLHRHSVKINEESAHQGSTVDSQAGKAGTFKREKSL